MASVVTSTNTWPAPHGRDANDDKSLQHVRHEVGMIPADPAMVGRDEHRPRRPERIEQAAEMGVGDGEGTDVLVAVPAVVVTHEIGQGEVHQGKVVSTLGERRDRSVGRTSILVGVVAAVDHEPMLRRGRR